MITNIPTADGLNEVALRLYFSAWSSLIRILSDFDLAFEPGIDWSDELAEYMAACQPELQSICALIQQSNELALKAKICEVSPFLLLLKGDAKFATTVKNSDFADFRTLDAVELPGAVNTFCKDPLTDKFISTYNLVRSLRNKIAHLGKSDKAFQPEELLHILVFQYAALWKSRAWLRDRVLFASQTRASFFHDGKYASSHMVVMHELPYDLKILTKSEFKLLFGHAKSTRRYLCHSCIDSANTRFADLDFEACKTAFLDKAGTSLTCVMCGEHHKVSREKCEAQGCEGNVISANSDEYAGMCHACGKD